MYAAVCCEQRAILSSVVCEFFGDILCLSENALPFTNAQTWAAFLLTTVFDYFFDTKSAQRLPLVGLSRDYLAAAARMRGAVKRRAQQSVSKCRTMATFPRTTDRLARRTTDGAADAKVTWL